MMQFVSPDVLFDVEKMTEDMEESCEAGQGAVPWLVVIWVYFGDLLKSLIIWIEKLEGLWHVTKIII